MKIFLDDLRSPPDDTWYICRTVYDVKILWLRSILISVPRLSITDISLDHDLGENQETGYDLVKWFEEMAFNMTGNEYEMLPVFHIHSANPVGRDNMEAGIKSIERMKNGKR